MLVLSPLVVFLLVATAIVAFQAVGRPGNARKSGEKKSGSPPEKFRKPEAYDRLSGLPTTAQLSSRRPLAVMVENLDPDARPQSGLDQAGIVFEMVAEGGITRFMAVFGSADAGSIGPIRSAREYYVNMAKGFDAVYVHCGGSDGGLKAIRNLGVDDIDEIGWSTGFWRIKDRYAPHNLYSSTGNLREQASAKGHATTADSVFYTFKEDPGLASRPETQTVVVDFSSSEYRVEYVYQRSSNSYRRFMGDKPHVDAVSGKQLIVKNIAVMYTRITNSNDYANPIKVVTVGGGDAVVVHDGTALKGTWKRPSVDDPVRFYDQVGREIELNRGQTWIAATDKPVTLR